MFRRKGMKLPMTPSTTLDIYTRAFDKNQKAASQIMQSSLKI